jgi:hypothetical protein
MKNRIVLALAALLVLFACLFALPVAGQQQFSYQYAAKILCTSNIPGTSQTTGSVLPGNYQTVVNIHNPNNQVVSLQRKIATPLGISHFYPGRMKPDEAASVNCQQITQGFGLHFIHGAEGFLVIESSQPLDVIAVYTAGKRGGDVESIDVEKVQERKLR